MSILEKLQADLKTSLKSADRPRADLLRLVLSQIRNREIEKRGKGDANPLTDEELVDVLRKETKKRKESMELFEKGGREDLKAQEEGELKIILEYLPPVPTHEDIVAVVDALRKEGLSEFPMLMKEAMKKLQGADGGEVVRVIKGE